MLTVIGFIAQTPNDKGPFCSLSVTALPEGTGGIFIADKDININELLKDQRYYYNTVIGMDFLLLPIRLLEWHVNYTGRQLTELQRKVVKVEDAIASIARPTNYIALSQELNVCNSLQLTLDRRWNFDKTLAQNLLRYFEVVEPPPRDVSSPFMKDHHPVMQVTPYPRNSIRRVKFHLQLSSAYEYDIYNTPSKNKTPAGRCTCAPTIALILVLRQAFVSHAYSRSETSST